MPSHRHAYRGISLTPHLVSEKIQTHFFLRNNLNWWAFQSYLHGERWKDRQITKIIPLFINVAFFLFYISWNKLVYPFTNIFDISVFFFLFIKIVFADISSGGFCLCFYFSWIIFELVCAFIAGDFILGQSIHSHYFKGVANACVLFVIFVTWLLINLFF